MLWPRAILFDLDDTLVTGDALSDVCWTLVCDRFWKQTSAADASQLREAIGTAADWTPGPDSNAARAKTT